MIFSPQALDPDHLAAVSNHTPLVLLGEPLTDSPTDYVAIDNDGSAREVVRHLLTHGRRRIGFLGGQPRRPTAVGELRRQGYWKELAEGGIAGRASWMAHVEHFTREEGELLTRRPITRAPGLDAIVCASDLLAIGALNALRRPGVDVPSDIAVVGWTTSWTAVMVLPA